MSTTLRRLHIAYDGGVLYPAFMKRSVLLAILLLLSACGGRKMNDALARNLIVGMNSNAIHKNDVEIVNVRQISANAAVAETRALVAFKFENDNKAWRVREIRIGHGQWENIENLEKALTQVKTEETKELMAKVVEAIQKYRDVNQRFPVFKDFIDLSDQISPGFMTPLVRLDAWRVPFEASLSGENIVLRSAGPDGVMGTVDDITLIKPISD